MGVYIFGEPGMLLVKVGVSAQCDLRAQALKRQHSGRLLFVYDQGSGLSERAAHRALKSRYWLQGEWFVCGLDVAKSVVRRTGKAQIKKTRSMRTKLLRRIRKHRL